MVTKSDAYDRWYANGYSAGYSAALLDSRPNSPQVQQQFYDLTPHDLDTIAMGVALVVLHSADIQTIAATMDTQRKLGVAERVLGWLHLICTSPTEYTRQFSLPETAPHPWLNPNEPTFGAGIAENQAIDDAHNMPDLDGQMRAYDELEF